MRKLRILFVGTAVDISISDSARGYLNALRRAGHEVYHFNTTARIMFCYHGLKGGDHPEMADNFPLCSRLASEWIVAEALRQRSDLVIVASGLALHPDGLELLNRTGKFPTVLILTESPYDDERQKAFAQHCGTVFTNDKWSAKVHDWHYLASAYDPEFHHPYAAERDEVCDVLFVGTGWPERQKLLESIDWDGIHLRLMGMWPTVKKRSPLYKYVEAGAVTNDETARLYSSAKIVINHHRKDSRAYSLNPRAYELGASGTCQVSDWRPEMDEVFGLSVPVYRTAEGLRNHIRHLLSEGGMVRKELAIEQQKKLREGKHTFDDRVATLMEVLSQ